MGSSATERVVVLMTPGEKSKLERKAKRIGTSAAELVRRSVEAYDPDADEAELERLLGMLTEAHERTLAALDRAERELKETRAYFDAKKKARA